MNKLPKWQTANDGPESTRKRSTRTETNIAKLLKGRVTINSGATFFENDVVTDYAEIEAKTTAKNSFAVNMKDWEKLRAKTKVAKIPMMVLDFETHKQKLAVISFDDLKYLIDKVNGIEI